MHALILRHAFIACALACAPTSPLTAQDAANKDRMPAIAADKLTDAQKKAAEAFAEGRGYAVRGPFVPLIRSPEVMLRAKAMGDYLRFKSTLGPRLNEMVILITAREWTQQYEWNAHHPIALKAGPATRDRRRHRGGPPPRRHGRGRGDRLRHGDRDPAPETRERPDLRAARSPASASRA